MARKPKHSLRKGETRSPEEHRRILEMMDQQQRDRSFSGKKVSKKRIVNTFGVSQCSHYAKSSPKKPKAQRIYDVERFNRE